MKKLIYLLLMMILVVPTLVNAGSITISKYQVNLNPGDTTYVQIIAKEATGHIQASSTNANVASVTTDTNFWIDSETLNIGIKANSVGMCSIKISVDGGDYDEVPIITTYSIVVYVNESTTTTTTTKVVTTTPNRATTTNKPTTTKKNNNSNTTTKVNTTTTTTSIINETPNEIVEEVTEPITEIIEKETGKIEEGPVLNNIHIVGYNIDFKNNKTNYKITIPNELKELYILTEKNDNISSNEGLINIEDKDFILIEAKDINTKKSKIYKIEFIRKEYSKTNIAIILTILIIIIFILLILNIILFIRKKYNKKEKIIEEKEELIYRNDYFE